MKSYLILFTAGKEMAEKQAAIKDMAEARIVMWEALQLCQRFSVTQSFYDAWAELTSCYDRPDLLISECLCHLENIENQRARHFL